MNYTFHPAANLFSFVASDSFAYTFNYFWHLLDYDDEIRLVAENSDGAGHSV